ncbi:MAG: hypothetical protein J5545_00550 [Bacteroidaceae bacterium]|nr:hypothetical protein [Bacteroidaceae bacterium]
MKKFLMTLAAVLCCALIIPAQTSCTSDNGDNPAPEVEILAIDPFLEWGSSIADIEQHMQAKAWWQDGNETLEFWEDPYQSWHKWYYISDDLTEQYLFETEDGQNLRYVICCCWDNTIPVEQFRNTLYHQGFHSTGNTLLIDGDIYEQYNSADGQTDALLNIDNEGYGGILYLPTGDPTFYSPQVSQVCQHTVI